LTLVKHYANVNSVSIKTQIKRLEHYEVTHKSAFERLGAIVLTLATVFSMTELGNQDHHQLVKRDVITQQNYVLNSGAENEMERLPIKFDDGLTAQSNSGI
jgi:hypothetical protein